MIVILRGETDMKNKGDGLVSARLSPNPASSPFFFLSRRRSLYTLRFYRSQISHKGRRTVCQQTPRAFNYV